MRKLPDWLSAYAAYTAHSEAPDNFHYWTGISVLAGATRRHLWMDMLYFQWTPCFYIVFVAPPGIISKTTTANIGMNLLRQVPGIHFGPDAVTWQSLVQTLAHSAEAFDYKGEALPMSAITIVSSEFGTFLNPNDREMVDILVSLWDGQVGVWEKATKTQGTDKIINPWVNILACTTPAWIQGSFPEYLIGGGFTSRTIFVYGESKRKLVAYPSDFLTKDVLDLQELLLEDLIHISDALRGNFTLTKEARKWGEDWYENLYEQNKEKLVEDRFAGYIARKQTHLHKLAMMISVSYKDQLEITLEDLQRADTALLSTEEAQPKVFSKIVDVEARPANIVLDILERCRKMEYEALYRKCFKIMSSKQFIEALESGQRAGLLKQQKIDGKVYYVYTSKD